MVVQRQAQVGEHRSIRAEYLARPGTFMDITYRSDRAVVGEGDFISVRGKEVSVMDIETMTEMRFPMGGVAAVVPRGGKAASIEKLPPLEIVRPPRRKFRPTQHGNSKPSVEPTGDLKREEMKHFHTNSLDLNALCDRLGPDISGLMRRGFKKPRAIAEQLNRAGFRTACGELWTARLVKFLIALIFEVPTQNAERAKEIKARQPRSLAPREMTLDEMASALARIGRVKRGSIS